MSTLQEQGNAAFRAKQWDEALSLYERALQAAGLENPSSDAVGTLYSNLCATRMHLHQYDQALNDANSAIRPKWSRAYARRAEALTRLQSTGGALEAYSRAISLADDERAKKHYEAAFATVKANKKPGPEIIASASPDGFNYPYQFNETYVNLLKSGGTAPPGSSAALTIAAWQMVEGGMNAHRAWLRMWSVCTAALRT